MTETSSFPFAFFEGKIIPTELAKINIMTNALQYGNAIIGGIRGYLSSDKKKVNVFRIEDHYTRFLKSLKIVNKTIVYNHKKLIEITLELARKNNPKTDCYFRPFAYAKNYVISPDMSKLEFDFALYSVALEEYLSLTKGLKLIISNWVRLSDNMIPARAKISGGYINSSLAKGDAAKLGFDDALMMTADGHIAEGSGANFFIVRDGVLITSPKHADILEGITRKTIMELAIDLKIPIQERMIDKSECYIADEAFLCGTGAQLSWVNEIDGRLIGDGRIGSITSKIQKLFFSIVRGNEKRYAHWLTRI